MRSNPINAAAGPSLEKISIKPHRKHNNSVWCEYNLRWRWRRRWRSGGPTSATGSTPATPTRGRTTLRRWTSSATRSSPCSCCGWPTSATPVRSCGSSPIRGRCTCVAPKTIDHYWMFLVFTIFFQNFSFEGVGAVPFKKIQAREVQITSSKFPYCIGTFQCTNKHRPKTIDHYWMLPVITSF